MNDTRIQRAKGKALECYFDYILEVRPCRDFVEIVGSMGGDVMMFRFYDSGAVTQR